jgi:Baseplate J-like protein
MSDEQLIYLDPNDDLHRVTERLEESTKQRVVIIVPLQTQLRSHTMWRVLDSRARAMGKEVIIISADRQVRSLARISGFRVADALDSSSSSPGKTRPSSSGRSLRSPFESRQGRHARSSSERRPAEQGASREMPRDRQAARQDRVQESTWREADSAAPPAGEPASRQGPAMDASPLYIEESKSDRPYKFSTGGSQAAPVQPSPRLRSADEEEPDPFMADYETSRRIQASWQSGQSAQLAQPDRTFEPDMVGEFSLPSAGFEPASSAPPRGTSPERDTTRQDPFEAIDDRSSVSLPEQRGAAFVQDVDDGVPDIAARPDEVKSAHKIEDLGEDEGYAGLRQIPQRQRPDMFPDEPEEYENRRVYGSRSRSSRSGGLARRQANDFYDADQLAPIADRPTAVPIVPVQPAIPASQPPAAARAGSGAVAPHAQAPRTGAPAAQAARAAQNRGAQARQTRRGSRVVGTLLIVLMLLFLVGVGLFYFGTSATVTLTVPSKIFTSSGLKVAASTNPQDRAQNTVASQVLSYTATATGSGTATGTTQHGNSVASGQATFTNNGLAPVEIPSQTTISTTAGAGTTGTLFVTTADFIIPAKESIPVPILAKNPGSSGNAGAGKIIVIPADSLTAIANFNKVPTSSLNLSVTNPGALTGGGAMTMPAATKNDIDALKLKLHQKIQAQVKAWLQGQLRGDDQHGTLMPDVLGSANPLSGEVLTQAPAAGQALTSTTITGTLTVQVRVLVVRAADLQAAAQQQLTAQALKEHPPYTITTAKAPVQISTIASSASPDGASLTITFNATALTLLYIKTSDLSSYLAGKTVAQARSGISSGDAGIQGVQSVVINVTPSFLNLMPFRPEHIVIIVRPGTGPAQNGTPNG